MTMIIIGQPTMSPRITVLLHLSSLVLQAWAMLEMDIWKDYAI